MSLILYPEVYYRRIARFISHLYKTSQLVSLSVDTKTIIHILYSANINAYNQIHALQITPDTDELFKNLETVDLISNDFAATALQSYVLNFEGISITPPIKEAIDLVNHLLVIIEKAK
ncbi:MAG: hypothetical protein KBT36_18090 [Kurthia sp.]|nr:hypothetical protein [Candidatus Kurthia equi]